MFKKMAFAAAAALSTMSTAQAAGVDLLNMVDLDGGTIAATWAGTPADGVTTFETDIWFNFNLDFYSDISNLLAGGSSPSSQVSGIYLKNLDTGVVLTTDGTFCDDAVSFSGTCNLIGESDAPSTLFTYLASGEYEFGLFDSANPVVGAARFSVTAIPVPAAGVLFGSAMLGAAFLRRRKLQSKLGLPE